MLNLPTVTLLGIDCVDVGRLLRAAEICQRQVCFASVKLLSSIPSEDSRVIPIPAINSLKEYSQFVLKQLDAYVETSHFLLIQHDGYILNAAAWTEEFLEYDYIGAPYAVFQRLVVGNGGFSLRSKKLSSLLAQDEEISIGKREDRPYGEQRFRQENEDQIISQFKRRYLEQRGIRFAPLELAQRFSLEGNALVDRRWNGQFGFHSFAFTDLSQVNDNSRSI